MNNQFNLDELAIEIKNVRKLMIITGTNKGLGNSETIKYSQELDNLIFQFQLQSLS
ncbi:aspartyl-phosphate phosphatase Spo0E family protein [Domibacillus indicus]|uniref:aspartyl-phosphate phosphatase Spo0E family protein n=1 Tax=Domibacillus indicus TaxID=1437523 RepID=UPI00203B8575|nr:aspartyl-phosphate phosphatase Spo0E family protein [Domibacillus indicus]MCM3789449.1 aspartyl-phosphate phosphatase Spo0E family protein [Domibacillus indicus]